MKSIFSKEEIEYLKDNYNKMTYKEIANELGFTERQIRGKINGMGLKKLKDFNKDYFKEINSPNCAYWLGFIYADGYLVVNKSNRNYELGIELNKKDVKLLNDFNCELGNCHKIIFKHNHKKFNGYEYDTNSCLIRIHSKEIVYDLMKHNIYPNKTNREEFPICKTFFFDFLRGFMDGDGCIHISNQNNIQLQFINSNYNFLKYIRETVYDLLGINGSIYKEKDKKYRLMYYKQKDVKCVLDKIYENDDCQLLNRKYNIYKSFYGSPS